jgi:hypothetical protein
MIRAAMVVVGRRDQPLSIQSKEGTTRSALLPATPVPSLGWRTSNQVKVKGCLKKMVYT